MRHSLRDLIDNLGDISAEEIEEVLAALKENKRDERKDAISELTVALVRAYEAYGLWNKDEEVTEEELTAVEKILDAAFREVKNSPFDFFEALIRNE